MRGPATQISKSVSFKLVEMFLHNIQNIILLLRRHIFEKESS